MERLFETLEGGWATLAGGAFLAASFAFVTAGYSPVFDPAWITVAICGLPIFREAFEHIVERRKISSPFLIALATVASIAIGEVSQRARLYSLWQSARFSKTRPWSAQSAA